MENNTTPINMRGLIKNTKGTFFTALILFLIPLLIINLYTFYTAYNGFTLDLTPIEQFDFSRILNGDYEAVDELQALFPQLITYGEENLTVTDSVFEILNFVLAVISDTFFILLGLAAFNNEKRDALSVFAVSFKRCFPTVLCCLFSSFVIAEAQSAVTGAMFSVTIFSRIAGGMFLPASIGLLAVIILLSAFIVSWLMLFIYYMNVTGVIGRARTFLTLGYARELLRGRVMKNIFRIMPFTALSIILPIVLNATAILIFQSSTLGLVISAIGFVLQFTFNALTWMLVIPDFFALEQESGIREKIKEIIDKLQNQQNSKEN